MKLYINQSTDPQFNLAAEEYLLTHADTDIIMLWRNESSVIIGKNQNAFTEVDLEFTRERGIKVVRRMTGGGAVFHDLGNLNYTFISPGGGELSRGVREGGLDFAHFTKPIIGTLCELGIRAHLSGRNDIVADTDDGERKISGNAQCVLDGTTLHHGTLLFSAKMDKLQGALRPDEDKLRTKGIASVRSRVANIIDLLPSDKRSLAENVEAFTDYIAGRMSAEFNVMPEGLPRAAVDGADELLRNKYSTDVWNIGRFGDFSVSKKKRFPFGSVEADLKIEEGRIASIRFGGDFFGVSDVSELAALLVGCEYSESAIAELLRFFDVGQYIFGANGDEIAEMLVRANRIL